MEMCGYVVASFGTLKGKKREETQLNKSFRSIYSSDIYLYKSSSNARITTGHHVTNPSQRSPKSSIVKRPAISKSNHLPQLSSYELTA